MGDRRTAELKTSRGSLYVYTHWCGSEFPEIAKAAVKRAKPRLGDESYYLRIVLDELIKDGRDEEAGFGLSVGRSTFEDEYNNDSPSIIIDCKTGKVTVYDYDEERPTDWE